MLSKFFLDRPVFAWVIAIIIILAGLLAIHNLPVSQYPSIAPPSIYIQTSYPGASAETAENTVTQIIEQKMTGIDKMIYLTATSDSSGSSRLEMTFEPGTDPDLAWAKVQNKLQLAMASLPLVVQQQGVSVGKATRNYLMVLGLVSEDGSMDNHDLWTMPSQTWRRLSRGFRAWARLRSSAPSTPCASGSTRTGSPIIPSPWTTWLGHSSRTTWKSRRVSSGRPGRSRSAPQRLHHRPEPPQDPRGVRLHPHPHQSGRLHRPDQRRRTGGVGNRSRMTSRTFSTANRAPAWPSGR